MNNNKKNNKDDKETSAGKVTTKREEGKKKKLPGFQFLDNRWSGFKQNTMTTIRTFGSGH